MSAHEYRRHAADCLKVSREVADPGARALLERMALAWMGLADRAEKNLQNDALEPPRSLTQQQRRPPKGLDFDALTPEEQRRVFDG